MSVSVVPRCADAVGPVPEAARPGEPQVVVVADRRPGGRVRRRRGLHRSLEVPPRVADHDRKRRIGRCLAGPVRRVAGLAHRTAHRRARAHVPPEHASPVVHRLPSLHDVGVVRVHAPARRVARYPWCRRCRRRSSARLRRRTRRPRTCRSSCRRCRRCTRPCCSRAGSPAVARHESVVQTFAVVAVRRGARPGTRWPRTSRYRCRRRCRCSRRPSCTRSPAG